MRSGGIEWSKVRGTVTVLYVFFFFAIESNIKRKRNFIMCYIKVLFIININNKNNHLLFQLALLLYNKY